MCAVGARSWTVEPVFHFIVIVSRLSLGALFYPRDTKLKLNPVYYGYSNFETCIHYQTSSRNNYDGSLGNKQLLSERTCTNELHGFYFGDLFLSSVIQSRKRRVHLILLIFLMLICGLKAVVVVE